MRRFIFSALSAIIVIIVFVFLFNIVRGIFTGNDDKTKTTLKAYDLAQAGRDGKELRYTTKGAIVGQERHHEIRISVDKNQRKIEVLKGYQGEIESTAEFPNTTEAYNSLVEALIGAGYTSALSPADRGDEDRVCTTGHRFFYEVAPNTSESFRSWYTNCSKKYGTFNGNSNLVRTLFQRQIPEYDVIVKDVRLN